MVVDFRFKKESQLRVAFVEWKGPWQEGRIRREFESLAKWLRAHGARTGRWVFMEPAERRFRAAIEVKGTLPNGVTPSSSSSL